MKNYFKKFIILSLTILFLFNIAYCKDYNLYCSNKNVHKTFSGNIISLVGINMLSRNVIESQIQKVLMKELNSKFKVKINNFYGTNVLNGEFRNLSAKTKKLKYNDLVFQDLKINTICDYNHITYKNNDIFFEENMVLNYNLKITQDNINEITNSDKYRQIIEKINNDKTVSSLVKIISSTIEIKNNNLYFIYEIKPLPKYDIFSLSSLLSKPIKLSFKSWLEVHDGVLKLCGFKLNSKSFYSKHLVSILNKFNPTLWNIEIDKNKKGKIFVDEVEIVNSEILLNGHILICKNKE